MQNLLYKVAGLFIRVSIPDGLDPSRVLPSFVPFVAAEEGTEPVLSVVTDCVIPIPAELKPAIQETNDMGLTEIFQIDGNYVMRFSFMGLSSVIRLSDGFSRAEVQTDFSHRYAGHVLTSMVRTAFAQAVVLHDGLSLHSSTVVNEGKGYMFMGKSGTGKSTHSRLWMSAYPGTWLLNDDNPIVRFTEQGLYVFGSPWSGKTPCYRNEGVPVAGIVRLSQAPANNFQPLHSVQAFIEVYQGTSVIRSDSMLHDHMCDVLSRVAETVKVAHLHCLPDEAAARLCHDSLQ